MIAIIDYGMGNLRSVEKALQSLGADCKVTREAADVRMAGKVVLPGVGAFGPAMQRLREAGMVEAIHDTIAAGKPFLGICLGQQLLFERSYEMGEFEGLGIVPGKVVRFPAGLPVRVPHMGWNTLHLKSASPLFRGVEEGIRTYFVHSYYGVPEDDSWAAANTYHGLEFAASLWKGNVFATQFHPEKSGSVGLKMLRNFAAL